LDRTLAKRLDFLELKERLSGAALLRCEKKVHGKQAQASLMALADKSVFLSPSASEVPSLAEPDAETQKAMFALTERYVTETLRTLPDFYATRVTTTFRRSILEDTNLTPYGTSTVVVYYRDGKEVTRSDGRPPEYGGLVNRGVFGPILAMAMLDSAKGNLVWSHWEQSAMGPVAVYSYSVPKQDSHYELDQQIMPYTCQVAVDPATGAIMRLVVETVMDPAEKTADIEVEYGPVELGGKTYICPIKSVVLTQDISLTWLNDVVFAGYHLFRGEYRILPGFTQVP
jgi:hypothetical protein